MARFGITYNPSFNFSLPKERARDVSLPPPETRNLFHLGETLARYEHDNIKCYAEGIRSLRFEITGVSRSNRSLTPYTKVFLNPSFGLNLSNPQTIFPSSERIFTLPRGYIVAA